MVKKLLVPCVIIFISNKAMHQEIIKHSGLYNDYAQAMDNILTLPAEIQDRIAYYLGTRNYEYTSLFTNTHLKHNLTNEYQALSIGGAEGQLIAIQTRRSFVNNDYALMIWDLAQKKRYILYQEYPLHMLIGHPYLPEFLLIDRNKLSILENKDNHWLPREESTALNSSTVSHALYTANGTCIVIIIEQRGIAEELHQSFTQRKNSDFSIQSSATIFTDQRNKILAAASSSDSHYIIVATQNNKISIKDLETFTTCASIDLPDTAPLRIVMYSPCLDEEIVAYGNNVHTLRWAPSSGNFTLQGSQYIAPRTIKTFLHEPKTITFAIDRYTACDIDHQQLIQQDTPGGLSFSLVPFSHHENLRTLTEAQAIFIMYLQELKKAFAERHEKRLKIDPSYRYTEPLPLGPRTIALTQCVSQPEKREKLYRYIHKNFNALPLPLQDILKRTLYFDLKK